MKYFSFCYGIEGFRRGIEEAVGDEWECIGGCELNPKCGNPKVCKGEVTKHTYLGPGLAQCDICGKINFQYADAITQFNYRDHKNYGDATKLKEHYGEIPGFDLLVGGFPCQAFSIAGDRQGFADPRGTLFFEIERLCEEKRPSYILLENVQGLISHDNRRTITTIYHTLIKMGYTVESMVLNSKYFGVPQNRERIFIIGHLRNGSGKKVFPLREGYGQPGNKKENEVMPAITTKNHSPSWRFERGDKLIQVMNDKKNGQALRVYDPVGIAKTISSSSGGQGVATGLYTINSKVKKIEKNPEQYKLPLKITVHNRQPRCGDPKRGGTGPLSRTDNIAYTADTGNTNAIELPDGSVRRLTLNELARIQGFPDGWAEFGLFGTGTSLKVKPISDTQQVCGYGNAVTVFVIRSIIRKLNQIR